MNAFTRQNNCIHRSFTFTSKEEFRDNIVCAECGDKVSLQVPDDDDAEVFFEILHKEDDGTYTAFHRSYREQMKLSLNLDRSIH